MERNEMNEILGKFKYLQRKKKLKQIRETIILLPSSFSYILFHFVLSIYLISFTSCIKIEIIIQHPYMYIHLLI